jgi:hypothetical protein
MGCYRCLMEVRMLSHYGTIVGHASDSDNCKHYLMLVDYTIQQGFHLKIE